MLANPFLSRAWPTWDVFRAPRMSSISGRPISALSFAATYQFFEFNASGYRAVNLGLHVSAALLLFGLIRRTVAARGGMLARSALPIGFCAAAVWALHPLNALPVNYITQRIEILATLFYMATFYSAVRCWTAENASGRRAWVALAIAAAALGMGSKETMVTAPVALLMFARMVWYGSWNDVWREGKGLLIGVASTWLILAACLAFGGVHEGVNLGKLPYGPIEYCMTQAGVILLYVRLSVVPYPLNLDYGWPFVYKLADAWLALLGMAVFLGVTAWGVRRNPRVGFCALAFFLILSPSSSVAPLPDAVDEYRMYPALAPLAVLFALGLFRVLSARRALLAGIVCATALGVVTMCRNPVYRSAISLWEDVTLKAPLNARGFANLGTAYAEISKFDAALACLRQSYKLNPDYPQIRMNYGAALAATGQLRLAKSLLQEAAEHDPQSYAAQVNCALVMADLKQWQSAIPFFKQALTLNDTQSIPWRRYGDALKQVGRADEANAAYDRAQALEGQGR